MAQIKNTITMKRNILTLLFSIFFLSSYSQITKRNINSTKNINKTVYYDSLNNYTNYANFNNSLIGQTLYLKEKSEGLQKYSYNEDEFSFTTKFGTSRKKSYREKRTDKRKEYANYISLNHRWLNKSVFSIENILITSTSDKCQKKNILLEITNNTVDTTIYYHLSSVKKSSKYTFPFVDKDEENKYSYTTRKGYSINDYVSFFKNFIGESFIVKVPGSDDITRSDYLTEQKKTDNESFLDFYKSYKKKYIANSKRNIYKVNEKSILPYSNYSIVGKKFKVTNVLVREKHNRVFLELLDEDGEVVYYLIDTVKGEYDYSSFYNKPEDFPFYLIIGDEQFNIVPLFELMSKELSFKLPEYNIEKEVNQIYNTKNIDCSSLEPNRLITIPKKGINKPNLSINYKSLVGRYYLVTDIVKSKDALYQEIEILKLEEKETKQVIYYKWPRYESSYPFLVVGYFEKFKKSFINKNFMLKPYKYNSSKDINTGKEINATIGTKWKCTDVTLSNDTNDMIIVLRDNKKQEISFMPEYFSQEYGIFSYAKAVKYRKRFGTQKWNTILNGKVSIGMTKEMCELSWGKPESINSTITSYGKREQWVYDSNYLYFDNGILDAIQ